MESNYAKKINGYISSIIFNVVFDMFEITQVTWKGYVIDDAKKEASCWVQALSALSSKTYALTICAMA